MLRLAYSRQCFSSAHNRNFFEINPIYPKVGEHEYKLYGQKRTRITPIEHFANTRLKQHYRDHALFRALTKADKRLADKHIAQKIIVDAETHLPYGMGFDSYIYTKKGEREIKKIDRSYSESITKLINKLKLKSEPELVRFFRLALADERKGEIKEQIKGVVLKNLVLEAVGSKNSQTLEKYLKNPREAKDSKTAEFNQEALDSKAFELALAEVDRKIEQVEHNLNIHSRYGLRNELFNPYFKKYEEVKTDEPSPNTDIRFDRKSLRVRNVPSVRSQSEFQDAMIERRISRLYFLKKLQLEKDERGHNGMVNNFVKNAMKEFKQVNPINFELKVQKEARKYNIEDLIPAQSEEDIYKEVELFVNSLKVDIKSRPAEVEREAQPVFKDITSLEDLQDTTSKISPQKKVAAEEQHYPQDLHFQLRDSKDWLWRNIEVAEVFDMENIYTNSNIKVNDNEKHPVGYLEDLTQNKEIIVSPNADLEVSLNTLPYNLYKHSDFAIFGLFNDQLGDLAPDKIGTLMEPWLEPKIGYNRFQFENPTKLPPRPEEIKEAEKTEFYAGGKRKTSHALCRIRSGTGMVKINRKNLRDYYADTFFRAEALKPLLFSGTSGYVDVDFFVSGGGLTGQAEACCLALVRALIKFQPRLKRIFRLAGLVTQDPRFVERKHSGHYKARKGYVYVRR